MLRPAPRLCLLALLSALAVVLCSCASTRSAHAVQTRQTRTETHPTADGGSITITTERTVTDADEHGSMVPDTQVITSGASMVAGALGGPWGEIASLAIGTITTAYAVHQQGKAKAATTRAEEHKADAAEGWAKAQEHALHRNPPTEAGEA